MHSSHSTRRYARVIHERGAGFPTCLKYGRLGNLPHIGQQPAMPMNNPGQPPAVSPGAIPEADDNSHSNIRPTRFATRKPGLDCRWEGRMARYDSDLFDPPGTSADRDSAVCSRNDRGAGTTLTVAYWQLIPLGRTCRPRRSCPDCSPSWSCRCRRRGRRPSRRACSTPDRSDTDRRRPSWSPSACASS